MNLTCQIYKRFNLCYIVLSETLNHIAFCNHCECLRVTHITHNVYCEHSTDYRLCCICNTVWLVHNTTSSLQGFYLRISLSCLHNVQLKFSICLYVIRGWLTTFSWVPTTCVLVKNVSHAIWCAMLAKNLTNVLSVCTLLITNVIWWFQKLSKCVWIMKLLISELNFKRLYQRLIIFISSMI